MLIAIDESGSFVRSPTTGSWCVVAAYVFAERRKTRNLHALTHLKTKYGLARLQEIKLRDLKESDYFRFVSELGSAGGTLFAVATDAASAETHAIEHHRTMQSAMIRKNVPRMTHEEGKRAVAVLADEIDSLAPQLYIQLVCQVVLLSDILRRAILFYVQRDPVTLRRFVWRIDQKNTERSTYERAFVKVAPGLLQTESFRDPAIFLSGADYSYFRRFEFPAEEYPKYLQTELGHEQQSTANIGKILHEDMKFPNSKDDLTVQIADLLASGIRRCLRGDFSDNRTASKLLGRLMVANIKPKTPIALVHLSKTTTAVANATAAHAVHVFNRCAQSMLTSA